MWSLSAFKHPFWRTHTWKCIVYVYTFKNSQYFLHVFSLFSTFPICHFSSPLYLSLLDWLPKQFNYFFIENFLQSFLLFIWLLGESYIQFYTSVYTTSDPWVTKQLLKEHHDSIPLCLQLSVPGSTYSYLKKTRHVRMETSLKHTSQSVIKPTAGLCGCLLMMMVALNHLVQARRGQCKVAKQPALSPHREALCFSFSCQQAVQTAFL